MISLDPMSAVEPYSEFFLRITGNEPLPFQVKCADKPFTSTLLIVPTGLGKTDASTVPFLYGHAHGISGTPTRLFVVLPRQNLTRQTANAIRKHRDKAGLRDRVRVLELLGGSEDNDETLRPDEPAIIVATQDLYFSRALNRGYARNAARWPIDFALYNQDCHVVLDEIQLMDDSLATSAQLEAFRESCGTFGPTSCLWMSATANPAWLRTVDFSRDVPVKRLTTDDLQHPLVQKRLNAPKSLSEAPEECSDPAGCAAFALGQHKPGTRTLVISNTVRRARAIYSELREHFPGAILVHSRFRPAERQKQAALLGDDLPAEGQIVIATQVLEAGVDISSHLLITDLASWPSMVQRFGRVNRYGELAEARILWVAEPRTPKLKDKNLYAPYTEAEAASARTRLAQISSASPTALCKVPQCDPEPWQHVLRRTDLMDLFDTTPDLAGSQIDVSRFIRATEEKDIYVAWRDWAEDSELPPSDFDRLADDELCPVHIGEFRGFLDKQHPAYTLIFATDKWEVVDKERLYPGMIVVTRCTSGGYTESEGWAPDSKAKVSEVKRDAGAPAETDSTDVRSIQRRSSETLQSHTARVRAQLDQILAGVLVDEQARSALRRAALLHDWGKAHPVFQRTMYGEAPGPEILAKSASNGRHDIPHFRHELASALAMLQTGETNLTAYIVAAHHGKVRMTIRSMPLEAPGYVRGIREGDVLPAFQIAEDVTVASTTLRLDIMHFGHDEGSWTQRMLKLLNVYGPFRLAYLEALLIAADWAASAEQQMRASV